ncbi:hypothetical protein CVT25_002780 [Psilocybe cyanescens]|uniref:Uncharacterized protein n=1 Tax=Psilocybe cyanescens TaxID=93625 RepID=A0A409WL37_PSICY|nr:hypothetical protein CVT25_002780 [Psilocybe cyanescens]
MLDPPNVDKNNQEEIDTGNALCQSKVRIINATIQEIGMGRYQCPYQILTGIILPAVIAQFNFNRPILKLDQNIGLLIGSDMWGRNNQPGNALHAALGVKTYAGRYVPGVNWVVDSIVLRKIQEAVGREIAFAAVDLRRRRAWGAFLPPELLSFGSGGIPDLCLDIKLPTSRKARSACVAPPSRVGTSTARLLLTIGVFLPRMGGSKRAILGSGMRMRR